MSLRAYELNATLRELRLIEYRFRVSYYFDNLVNKLNCVVETLIGDNFKNSYLVAGLNEQRDFIKEIRDVEAYDLRALKGMNIQENF
jgi:hypothetical protein